MENIISSVVAKLQSDSILEKLRKLMDLRATGENVCNIYFSELDMFLNMFQKLGKVLRRKVDSKSTKRFVSYQ